MIDANSEAFAVLAACCLCLGLGAGLLVLVLRFLRGHGGVLLPLLQLFTGREEAAEDALPGTHTPVTARPDLRAIAREHDFDSALAQQQNAPAPLTPPEWPAPPYPAGTPRRREDSPRSRDEDEELGFDTLDE